MMRELQSDSLFPSHLLIRSPNQLGKTGPCQDGWQLSPSASSSSQLMQLVFLGRVLGLALRTRNYLPLDLAPSVWKQILG